MKPTPHLLGWMSHLKPVFTAPIKKLIFFVGEGIDVVWCVSAHENRL